MLDTKRKTPVSLEVLERTVSFTVPLVPPSVNHYKKPFMRKTRNGLVQAFAVSAEAIAYKQAVAIFARGESISATSEAEKRRIRYGLFVRIVMGKGQYGDGDNFWKCVADGLVDAGVIHSDARVRRWHLDIIENDRENPRTEITATVLDESD